MDELVQAVASWHDLVFLLVVFGFAPGFVLRLLVRLYPKDDPRRTELIAELYALDRYKRPFFVTEQIETVLFEGLPHRAAALRQRLTRTRANVSHDSIPDHLARLLTLSLDPPVGWACGAAWVKENALLTWEDTTCRRSVSPAQEGHLADATVSHPACGLSDVR